MGQGDNRRPFYKNLEHTLEDVCISHRQLSYWRKEGLFNPELGLKTKYFTKGDIEHLHFLKRLIEDLKLPVAVVKKLMESTDHPEFASIYEFIDIADGTLVSAYSSMNRLISDAIVGADSPLLNDWFIALALQMFRRIVSSSSTPEVYEAQRKALLDRLDRMDRIARLHDEGDESFWFDPPRDGDPPLSRTLADDLYQEQKTREREITAAEMRRHERRWAAERAEYGDL